MTEAALLHGFTGSARSWNGVASTLRAGGIQPRLVDLPGHGSRAGRTDPAHFSLDATLESIAGAAPERGGLVGYSMGGRLALHFVVRHPARVSALVLESASPGLSDPEERARRLEADHALAESIRTDGVEDFVRRWEALPLFESQRRALSDEGRHRVRAGRLQNDPESLARSLEGVGTGVLPSLWESLPSIEIPTLVVVGALDTKFRDIGERMVERLANAERIVVPNAGHRVHVERPEAWCAAVVDFVTAHAGNAR